LSLVLELLLVGIALLWFTQKQKAGKILVTLGALLLLLFSLNPVADRILGPLERWYPAGTAVRKGEAPSLDPSIKWIVVLGGGHNSDPEVPVISQLSFFTLVRLVEGIALYRALPGARLLLSGGRVFDPVPEAQVMAQAARSLGVNPQDLVLEPYSRDTEEEAKIIKDWVGKENFILVTSASHQLRAVAMFRKQGMTPIPWPIGHRVKESYSFILFELIPNIRALEKTDTAFYEYLGLAWAWMRGVI
jgi:uncharacterized SAM-binding protein YcdF (DUF218 family)